MYGTVQLHVLAFRIKHIENNYDVSVVKNACSMMSSKCEQQATISSVASLTSACHLTSWPAPPSAPTIISLISTYSDQLAVTWTSVPTATSYNVSINDCVNALVPIPSTGAPQYTFTGLTNNTVYTVSVVAINCAGSSSPATMSNRTSKCASIPLIAHMKLCKYSVVLVEGQSQQEHTIQFIVQVQTIRA